MSWVRYVLSSIISKYWGCPLWILALSMRPKELFTINFSAWDPFSTRAPMNIKLRDPSHKPKLSLILLQARVGRAYFTPLLMLWSSRNDNGLLLISFYIFGCKLLYISMRRENQDLKVCQKLAERTKHIFRSVEFVCFILVKGYHLISSGFLMKSSSQNYGR